MPKKAWLSHTCDVCIPLALPVQTPHLGHQGQAHEKPVSGLPSVPGITMVLM